MYTNIRPRSAFTMLELIIVVAIILCLTGLATPAIQAVIHLSRRVVCASNLRQIGMAALVYAGEHDDFLPAAEKLGKETVDNSPAWFCRLPQYMDSRDVAHGGRVFQCSAWKDAAHTVFSAASPKSLKWNARLDDDGRTRHYRLGTWDNEASVCLMADGKAGETGMGQWGHLVPTGIDEHRHRGEVNVLCLDGHSQLIAKRPEGVDWADAITWVGGLNN